MTDIVKSPAIAELVSTADVMYARGWDERNAGNISVLLDEAFVAEYLDGAPALRTLPTGFAAPELDGHCFAVTAVGSYFRKMAEAPEAGLGIVRLADGGRAAHGGGESRCGFRESVGGAAGALRQQGPGRCGRLPVRRTAADPSRQRQVQARVQGIRIEA